MRIAVVATRNRCLLALLLLALGPGCRGPRPEPRLADADSIRTTTSGTVLGFEGRYSSHVWLGIPYAQPPTGDLRWRAPQPPESWKGTREMLAEASSCTQYASMLGGVDDADAGEPLGGEDCLYLNVWAPRFKPAEVPAEVERLPVMVWIHGGGNTIGTANFYDGGNLAATHDVVVVAMNYRLGPFGWFRHAALRGEETSPEERSGNFGTLDQIRALEWVRDNAAAFGGDPDRVTIFGESAGGQNVYMLLLSPLAEGLFHRAIVQSGGFWMNGEAEAENFADDPAPGHANSSSESISRLLVQDGTAKDRDAARAALARMSDAEVERYLRGKSHLGILRAYPPEDATEMIDLPCVFNDGVVLPRENAHQLLSSSEGYNRVPVIAGTNRDEDKLFMFDDPRHVRRLFWLIPRVRDLERYDLVAEYLSKMWKAAGADEPASAIWASGNEDVFVYRFDWDEEPSILGTNVSLLVGAAHGFEIPFVFGHFDLGREGNVIFTPENEPGRIALSAQMMSYWAQFAYAGEPGRGRIGDQVQWQPWRSEDTEGQFIVLDTAAGGGVRMSQQAVTVQGLLGAVEDDPRLPTQRDRCMIYRELALESRGITPEEYPRAGKRGCGEYPIDEYPWG